MITYVFEYRTDWTKQAKFQAWCRMWRERIPELEESITANYCLLPLGKLSTRPAGLQFLCNRLLQSAHDVNDVALFPMVVLLGF